MKTIIELAILCAAVTAAAAQGMCAGDASSTINFSPRLNAGSAIAVDKGYIGFGIEMKSFPDYSGHNAENEFSSYLLGLLSSRSNRAPIHIRIGGTSMDNARYNPDLTTTAINVTGDQDVCRLHTDVDIGKPYTQSFKNLAPKLDLRYTVQIPLARKNVNNGVTFAKACVEALTNSAGLAERLDAFEIGNEPNFYSTFGSCEGKTDRPSDWRPLDYAGEFAGYAANLVSRVPALDTSPTKRWFQALALSSAANLSVWKITPELWTTLDNGKYVKTISQHYYQGSASGDLKDELLTHSTTVSKMQEKFGTNIAFAADRNIDFILGEVGPAIGSPNGVEPNKALYGTLGGALWTLDFLLHGMTMGIKRVSMQLGTNFQMAAWQPVDNPPTHPKAVHGNFYGLAAAAKFIGGLGDLQIRALEAAPGHPNVVAYAGYHGGTLSKIAVLNLNVWNIGSDRVEKCISLTNLGDDAANVRVLRLTSPRGAESDIGLSWAGRRWTAEDDGKEYTVDDNEPDTIPVQGGAPRRSVVVKASEAVVIEIVRG